MNDNIHVTRSFLPPLEEYTREISDLWDSRWLTNMGEKHVQFEKSLQDFLAVAHCSLFVNGHIALELAIQALGFEQGCEVITTPFTFASTTHAIVRNKLTPVFCDVDENGLLDATKIEQLITSKTVAILPVHVYGNVCDVFAIDKIARKHSLKVIYDAAHAFGTKVGNAGIGSFGDMSMFSFHATKVFHSIEGGAVTSNDMHYIDQLYNLKNFGIRDAEHVVSVGGNGKMNEFQAAMGICNLRHIQQIITMRHALSQRYCENLQGHAGVRVLLQQDVNVTPNYAYMPVHFTKEAFGKSRDEVAQALQAQNIFARKYFYPLINTFDCYRNQYSVEDTPVAQILAQGVLTLPLYPDLSLAQVDNICRIILQP